LAPPAAPLTAAVPDVAPTLPLETFIEPEVPSFVPVAPTEPVDPTPAPLEPAGVPAEPFGVPVVAVFTPVEPLTVSGVVEPPPQPTAMAPRAPNKISVRENMKGTSPLNGSRALSIVKHTSPLYC
jgi:hypothetical protein